MVILAIDPGTTESAYVLWDGSCLHEKGKIQNETMLEKCETAESAERCVIEKVQSFGKPVGESTFETVFWSGRFAQAFGPRRVDRIGRTAVKNHICHSSSAKDPHIRQALIDRFGEPGTKKKPGLLYGVSGDVWAALALAVTWWDTRTHGAAT
jgi:hypothetical protein